MSDFLTVKEAAEVLRVNPMTIYRLIETGRLPHHRVGSRTIRIERDALDTLFTAGDAQESESQGTINPHSITRI